LYVDAELEQLVKMFLSGKNNFFSDLL